MMHRRLATLLLSLLLLTLMLPASVAAAVPDVTNDSDTIGEDSGADVIAVLTNDNSDAGPLSVDSVGPASHGTTSTDGTTVTYTPAVDFHGSDSFTYDARNDDGVSTATVNITVTSVNDAPVAVHDDFTIDEDVTTLLPVRANDTDADGDTLTITSSPDGAHGTTTIVGGQISYDPATNYHGTDSLTYSISDGHGGSDSGTVTVTIDPVNDNPVAGDDSDSTAEDTPVDIDVLADDTDVDGDSLSISGVTNPPNGTATVVSGKVHYVPDADYHGPDSFDYTVSDGQGGTDTGHVTVTVSSVNDPPVAAHDTATVTEDTPKTIDVLANDTDPDSALSIASVTNGAKGSVTNNGTSVTYVPALNATGSDTFTYTLAGSGPDLTATVDVTIDNVNDLPVAGTDSFSIDEDEVSDFDVLADDTDADGDGLTISDPGTPLHGVTSVVGGKIHYVPTANYHGADSFTYTVSDGNGGTDTALVSLTLASVNDAPIADDDTLGVPEDVTSAQPVLVLAGDIDPDGDTITIVAKTNGLKGVVAITGGGTGLTYKPNANAFGADSFTYTISDGLLTDVGTVTVDIGGANDPPNAVNDSLAVPQGAGATNMTVLANDTDPDGDTLTITTVRQGAHGVVTITGGGTGLTYNPSGIYKGTDTFTYTVSDGHGGTDSATVLMTIVRDTVKPVESAPVQAFFGQTAGSTTTKIRLTWGATDTGGTGVASYKVQYSVNGGTYTTITSSTTGKTLDRTLTTNRTYRFRVRATDKEGNVGSYAYGPTIKPTRYSESSANIAFVGTWPLVTSSKAMGGKHRYATSSSQRAVFSFTGLDVGWIATRTTSSGKAEVYLDGVLVRTVDLDRSSTAYRQIVFQAHFATLAAHTLELRPVGDGRVYLDGFVVDK